MGSPTMSSQQPQTGGKINQTGQPSGKGSISQPMMQLPGTPLPPSQMPPDVDISKMYGSQQQNPMGSGDAGMGQGTITYPSVSGQPQMGSPNQYSNTIGRPNQYSEVGSAYTGNSTGKGSGKNGA